MKYLALIFLVFLLSCSEKDTRDCSTCTTTYNITTDVPVSGYPATTTVDVELCDVTSEQIYNYEQTTKGSESSVVGNVTYTSNFSTKCKHN
jgi:hypothetical protein